MARNGSGVYSLPAGSIVTTGDTILAASHNDPLNDLASDANAARPVVAGGTGADNAADALVNLGLTATAAELNTLDGITATVAELNILDGVTATAAELNILDGVTATTAELNILDGVTATAAELNTLDGITATVTELNYTDGVTSAIQTQLNAKAALASPTFTGTPTAPTAAVGTNNTQLATTAYVTAQTGAFAAAGGTTTDLSATAYETRLSGTFVATGTKVIVTASCSVEHQSTSANDFLMQIVLKDGATTVDSYQIGNSYSGAAVSYSAILSGSLVVGSRTPGTTYTVEIQLRKTVANGPSLPVFIRYNGLSV